MCRCNNQDPLPDINLNSLKMCRRVGLHICVIDYFNSVFNLASFIRIVYALAKYYFNNRMFAIYARADPSRLQIPHLSRFRETKTLRHYYRLTGIHAKLPTI